MDKCYYSSNAGGLKSRKEDFLSVYNLHAGVEGGHSVQLGQWFPGGREMVMVLTFGVWFKLNSNSI